MGCCGSKVVAAEPPDTSQLFARSPVSSDAPPLAPPRMRRQARLSIAGNFNQTDNMKLENKKNNSDSSIGSGEIRTQVKGLCVRYAFLTQRGHYPDQPLKANQDVVIFQSCVQGNPGNHLWGVLDGHGEFGAECARFAGSKIQLLLDSDKCLSTDARESLRRSILAVNEQLHKSSNIDDSLSGTTACLVLYQEQQGADGILPAVFIANVGDSRAVLAKREGLRGDQQQLVAIDITSDQTPFRDDECDRVTRAGSRVMTMDQLEGLKHPGVRCWTNEENCDGDPPRCWAPDGAYPGTAFTRSIGDSVAERIGVFAEPEIEFVEIDSQYSFLILATDGVWEFLSSQRAVDIVSQQLTMNPGDPEGAIRALLSMAFKSWLRKEARTDDISVALLVFEFDTPPTENEIKNER